MKLLPIYFFLILPWLALPIMGEELKPHLLQKGKELLDLNHSDEAAAKKLWRPYSGTWLVKDGVMRASQRAAGDGIANARIVMAGQNRIFQFFGFVSLMTGTCFISGLIPTPMSWTKQTAFFL